VAAAVALAVAVGVAGVAIAGVGTVVGTAVCTVDADVAPAAVVAAQAALVEIGATWLGTAAVERLERGFEGQPLGSSEQLVAPLPTSLARQRRAVPGQRHRFHHCPRKEEMLSFRLERKQSQS